MMARLGFVCVAALMLGAAPAFAEHTPHPHPGNDSPGMYSEYSDSGLIKFDKYLGDTRPMPMAELLPALLDAIDQLSKYSRPNDMPAIHRVPSETVQELACGAKCGALATYRSGEGIYLDQRLKPETSLFDRSVLLHELVHYVQDLSNEHGDMRPCERWYYREIEAYAIQKQFLMIVGSPVRVGYSAARPACDEQVRPQVAKSLYE